MLRTASLTLFLLFSILSASADDFKVKIQVTCIDHQDVAGTIVTVCERGAPLTIEKVGSDGEVKLHLPKGKLLDVWFEKAGYTPVVIHNVHAEGKGKFDVVLFKGTQRSSGQYTDYAGAYRIFDDVKKMTIPVDELAASEGQGVVVISEDAMAKDEKAAYLKVQKVAADQSKRQKKIDKLADKQRDLESKRDELRAGIDAGTEDKTEGESKILKYQEAIVKLQKQQSKLAY